MNIKRLSKQLIVTGVFALYTINTFGATITDVNASHWAYSAIVEAEKAGYMPLNSRGQFFPSNTMTYFEFADVLAKATGYVDVNANTKIDAEFKKQIVSNYNAQKATLAEYAKKYSGWDKIYDQQVAYLLGRGYLTKSDLDKFTVTANGKNTKATITKQDIAVYIVRLLEKEKTAKANYKTTGFSDDSLIKQDNKAAVAYLKTIGLVKPDAKGAYGANTKVTRALCAKMMTTAMTYKTKGTVGTNTSTNTSTNTNTSANVNTAFNATIEKVVKKSDTEYYLLLNRGTSVSFYTIKKSQPITDMNGNALTIGQLTIGSKVSVTTQGADYINSLVVTNLASVNSETNQTTNTALNTTPSGTTQTQPSNESTSIETQTAVITEVNNTGIIRLTHQDGTIKAYVVDVNCVILVNGKVATIDDLQVGDNVIATLQNSSILKIQTTGQQTNLAESGELVEIKQQAGGSTLIYKSNGIDTQVFVPSTASITKNDKEVAILKLKAGDKITITKQNGIVIAVKAEGNTSNITGKVTSITLAKNSEIVVAVNGITETYTVGPTADIYDYNTKNYIRLRDIHLGQMVDILLDSKEVKVIDVKRDDEITSCKATIDRVGKNNTYIDVILDYDPFTGESKVGKRIQLTDDIKITLNGKKVSVNKLEADMDIIIEYKYLDDIEPTKIMIIE